MIIFNGFYFRGNWKTPFKLSKDDNTRTFYTSPEEKKQVSMIQTSGLFDIGTVPELDAEAVELPYEVGSFQLQIVALNYVCGVVRYFKM